MPITKSSPEFRIDKLPKRHFRLTILPGELPESWIRRACITLYMSRQRFFKEIVRHIPGLDDFDERPPTQLYRLAFITNNQPVRLRDAFQPHLTPWVSHVDYVCPERIPLYRFCPRCISEDEVPHIRLSWKLISSVICERHASPLAEFCGVCKTPFTLWSSPTPIRHEMRATIHRVCPGCHSPWGMNALPQISEPLMRTLLRFQRRFTQAFVAFSRRGKFTKSVRAFYDRYTIMIDQDVALKRINWRKVVGEALYGEFREAFPHLCDKSRYRKEWYRKEEDYDYGW